MALVVKSPPANTGDIRDIDLIPGLRRSPGRGRGNPLQYSCLENPMDRGAWRATVHEVSNSWTRLKLRHTCTHTGWEREMSLFGKIPHCRTSLTLTHRSPFSHRRNLGPNGSHLGRSCASQGRGDVGKVKLFFSPTPIHPNSYFIFFFLQQSATTSPLET